jgi:isoquinoline 1-oxidoreductase subunit alpha
MPRTLLVNRQTVTVQAEDDTPLLWVLRGELKLTGTKFGCGIGQCGACSVLLDGQAVRSCNLPVQAVGPAAVTTIEGVRGPEIEALRAAWTEIDVVQCGYCQSGQLIGAQALLVRDPQPDDAAIDAAMNSHLCRCGTYPRVRVAIHDAAKRLSMARRTDGSPPPATPRKAKPTAG